MQRKVGYQAGKLKKIGDEFLKSNEVKNIRNDLEILFSNPNIKSTPLGLPLAVGNPLIDPKDKEQIRLDKILNNEV